jgi:hypothetical protein
MVLIPGTMIHFDASSVKASPTARLACGVKITAQATSSPLYALLDVKAAVDVVIVDTATAQAALDTYNKAHGAFLKARTALGVALGGWDSSFDVLLAVSEKRCVTTDDAASLAMPVLLAGRTKHAFVMPLGVTLKADLKKNELVSHVLKATGLGMAVTQMSVDPFTATSWSELDGYGLVHRLPMPAPGRYWFRAAHKRARATSDFTAPVSILVK